MNRNSDMLIQQRELTSLLKEVTDVEHIQLIPSLARLFIYSYKRPHQPDLIRAEVRLRGALSRILSGLPAAILLAEQQLLLPMCRGYHLEAVNITIFINLFSESIYNDPI